MKFLCAPDSFKGSLGAIDVAAAMATGIRQIVPRATIDCCPVGDGGEGTLAALHAAMKGDQRTVEVSGPFGEDMNATFGIFNRGKRAYIESAACIGFSLVPPEQRDPTMTTSFGVGELLLEAAAIADEIVVGLGGSATNDGGCGMAQAIGYRFLDSKDRLIMEPMTGARLLDIGRIDTSQVYKELQGKNIIIACDVRNPLTGANGAASVFGPQKGASESQIALLEEGLKHLAAVARRDLNIDIEDLAGAGAAGGLGGGLVAFAEAHIKPGINFVLDMIRLSDRLHECNLCLTGEGRFDRQSYFGKACIGVARMAKVHGVPTVALVGSTTDDADSQQESDIQKIVTIGAGLPEQESIDRAAELISAAAAEQVRLISG